MEDKKERFVNVRIVMQGDPNEPFDAEKWLLIAAKRHSENYLSFAREQDGSDTMMSIEVSWPRLVGAKP